MKDEQHHKTRIRIISELYREGLIPANTIETLEMRKKFRQLQAQGITSTAAVKHIAQMSGKSERTIWRRVKH